MTAPAKSRSTSPDDERPDDLFDDVSPLETIPAAPGKVGPGHPPAHSRWKKGGPSPNPAGRPRKPSAGAMTKRMSKKMVVMRTEGGQATMTRREALDRVLRDLATRKGGKYLDLWNERKARDQRLREEREAYETQQRELKNLRTEAPTQWEFREQQNLYETEWRLIQAINDVIPGSLDIHLRLRQAGAIHLEGGKWIVADWLRTKRPG